MFGRNIDFFAILAIALTMLGLAAVRSWHMEDALDSIRFENAVHVEHCRISEPVMSQLGSIFH